MSASTATTFNACTKPKTIRCASLSERMVRQPQWRLVTWTNRGPTRYCSEMGDAATFIAPALVVAYLAVGCLLLWGMALWC